MRIAIILNPAAGSADEVQEAIEEFAMVRNAPIWHTRESGDGIRLAQRAVEEGFERVVAAGGDGTINEVANGLTQSGGKVEVAVVPLGTGNDFARSLGVPVGDVRGALAVAGNRPATAVDVARVTWDGRDEFFLNAACGGFGGEIAHEVTSEQKQRWGAFAYWGAALGQLADLPRHDVTLVLDGYETRIELCGLAAANGRFIAGGMTIAPEAMIDDGRLDLVVLPMQPVAQIIAAGLDTVLGRSQEGGRLWHFRASRIELRSEPGLRLDIDGESKGRKTQAVIEVQAGVLRAAAHADAPALSPGEAVDRQIASPGA